jgi:hypothetical protein
LTEAAIAAERDATRAAREALVLVERKLAAQREQAAADTRANEAQAARLASEQAAAQAAVSRADAEQAQAELARQRELAELAAVQAALEKREAQRALLEHAQEHAEMQRKAAHATQQMADARKQLVNLESRRQDDDAVELAATQRAIGERKVEAGQRSVSADLTREVLGRFKQSQARAGDTSAAQAAARLAEVIATQRELDPDRKP